MRYLVVFALFALSMITYMDRVRISTVKDPIARDLGLTDSAMGMVFGPFALGYALAQIPSGWFADRFGPRIALAAVVSSWRGLTALTDAAWSLTSLIAIRNWLPVAERGRANGVLFSGSRLGAVLSFPLLAWILARWQWRTAFLLLGADGVLWAAVCLLWFRDHPPKPLPVEAASGKSSITLREIFRSKAIGLAMAQFFASNLTFFLCLSRMLPYLKKQSQLADREAALYAMAPLVFGATSQGILGFALATIGVHSVTQMANPATAVACFTLAAFGADMTIRPSWVYCADITGQNTGGVSGSTNMLGNFGSFVSANAFPYLYGLTGKRLCLFLRRRCAQRHRGRPLVPHAIAGGGVNR